MSEIGTFTPTTTSQPPPAPPLPPSRLGPFQRLVAPLGLARSTRPSTEQAAQGQRPHVRDVHRQSYTTLPSQTVAHRTGIPIAALDTNAQGTHAILAGKDILKTVQVQDGKATEDFNLRADILSYASTHGLPQNEATNDRRNYLPARAVKWSVGRFDHIIATAAATGRIALYDVRANGSRVELAWLHDQKGQVNKLDFDPSQGYYLLSASSDKTVTLWDIREGKGTKATMRFVVNSGVRDVKWSPKESNNSDFAICADGGIIQNWDVRNPYAAKLSINAHDRGCFSLDWHPDGRHVVSGGFDKYVRVWDFKNDNRRQKPTFHFRAPQAVRNVRWRPPYWTSGAADAGNWQTTQIATTYHYDDPRIHIWDFGRPLLPLREIDMYNSPANDFLWASADLLWTVGDQGMFTQSDVTFATQVHRTLPPCALDWTPDGECAAFVEERLFQGVSDFDDPTQSFLSVTREKFSGSAEDGMQSRALEDEDDDLVGESMLMDSLRRNQSRFYSTVDAFHASSPPTEAYKLVLPLHEAVISETSQNQDDQTGILGRVEGVTESPEVVSFLANNYASIATESERRASPDKILTRLEQCFTTNAGVCDEASLHRMAQSWRILAAVIVPELKDWAERNRERRKAEVVKRRSLPVVTKSHDDDKSSPAFAKVPMRDLNSKSGATSDRPVSNLFKGIKETELGHLNDSSSTSNVTTPLAKPIQRSPLPGQQQQRSRESSDSSGGIESLQTLPPSLLSAHSTAAAAADALADNASEGSKTPPSSPEQYRDRAAGVVNDASKGVSSPLSPHTNVQTSNVVGSPRPKQTQEERRAALRDYRAQPRPVFSLDAPVRGPEYQKGARQDSAESFPMFSASSSSSFKAQSLGRSVESPEHLQKPVVGSWLSREDSSESASSEGFFNNRKPDSQEDHSYSGPRSGSSAADFAFDGSGESKELPQKQFEEPVGQLLAASSDAITQSSSPELFHLDIINSRPTTHIPITNPILETPLPKSGTAKNADSLPEKMTINEDFDTDEFIYNDFRPIDLTKYEPRLPFAWSALPLVCQMIAFDMDNGVACAQFAAHLILHIAPYFFHPSFHRTESFSGKWPVTLADRLMRPDLSHRIIEALLLKHCKYLQQMQLYQSFAEIRNASTELGFDRVNHISLPPSKDAPPSSTNPYSIATSCSHCQGPLKPGQSVCDRCHRPRSVCPICLSNRPNSSSNLWSYCHSCGHSSHTSCLNPWISDPSSHGACPIPDCTCDCAPGILRQQRIEHQLRAHEESRLIRGGGGGGNGGNHSTIKRDSVKASQSAAVDKTRAVLRRNDSGGTQSGDERGSWARRGSGSRSSGGGRMSGGGAAGSGSGGSGFVSGSRKSVRLVTPGEESGGK